MIAVAFVFWMSLSFGGPFHLRLWGAMYPARLVGRVVGFIGMGRAAAGALAAFAGGVIADRLGGPTRRRRSPAWSGSRARSPTRACAPRSAERPPSFSARGSIRALRERPLLGKVALAQGFYGGGLIAAVPLYALVHVDRLDLRLSDVGVIGILAAVATTVSFPVWGAVADRHGGLVGAAPGQQRSGSSGSSATRSRPHVAVLWVMAVGYGAASAADRCRHRLGRQRPDAAGLAGGRHGRLERDHRRARHRGRVPDERAAAARRRRRHVGPAAVRGLVGDRRGAVRSRERRTRRSACRLPVPCRPGSTVPTALARGVRPPPSGWRPPAPRPPLHAAMRLTAWEEERLLIFTAAELARRHRDRGLLLNAPEVVALICDAMLEAARAGADYEEVEAAGREAVTADQALPGVAALVDEVRLEVLMDDGVRLVVLARAARPGRRRRARRDPPGAEPASADRDRPRRPRPIRARRSATRRPASSGSRATTRSSASTRASSSIERRATGFRLDLPAGSSERWAPGETRTVDPGRASGR